MAMSRAKSEDDNLAAGGRGYQALIL